VLLPAASGTRNRSTRIPSVACYRAIEMRRRLQRHRLGKAAEPLGEPSGWRLSPPPHQWSANEFLAIRAAVVCPATSQVVSPVRTSKGLFWITHPESGPPNSSRYSPNVTIPIVPRISSNDNRHVPISVRGQLQQLFESRGFGT